MDVALDLFHEGLLHIERKAERLSEGVLRALLIVAMVLLMCIHPVVGALMICAALLRYGPEALAGRAREESLVDAHHSSIRAIEAAQVGLQAAEGRIQELERDLVIARANAGPSSRRIDPSHHAVGLHEGAPDWVVECVRRAYRLRLHPDRHPERHKQAAHARFVAAEGTFDTIYAGRGMKA